MTGTCYTVRETCANPNACIDLHDANGYHSMCATSAADCADVLNAYTSALSGMTVVKSGAAPLAPGAYNPGCSYVDCATHAGHCQQGLDTCWLIGGSSSDVDRLAQLYSDLGCPALATCNCPPAPQAICETNPDGGPAYSDGGTTATSACIVR